MSGAVYQPTTVTYESNNLSTSSRDRRQNRPVSYLGAISHSARRPCQPYGNCFTSSYIVSLVMLVTFIMSFTIGLVMVINGSVGYAESKNGGENLYLILTIIGAAFLAVSLLIFLNFLRITRRMCWRHTKNHLSSSGEANLAVNPSTDLLVTAQYAPVSELTYETNKLEDTEQSKLMPKENKEISNEDADRLIENDPRIVLRPLNTAINEET